jgi:F-type H+-transporting ATPase subunit b
MDAILHTFGIDWRLLLVNAVNFGILLAGLTYFLYKPLGKMLEERRQKIAKGVEDAHAAEVALSEIESSRKETLAKAGEEADAILSHSRQAAASKAKELMNQAEAAAARAIADAEKQGGELKNKAIEESKQEVAKMIVLGMEKLAKQK